MFQDRLTLNLYFYNNDDFNAKTLCYIAMLFHASNSSWHPSSKMNSSNNGHTTATKKMIANTSTTMGFAVQMFPLSPIPAKEKTNVYLIF